MFGPAMATVAASAEFARLEEQFEKSVSALQAEHKAKLAKPGPRWLSLEPVGPGGMVFFCGG